MGWQPVLDGDLAVRARARLDALAAALASRAEYPDLSGSAGRAVLFALREDADAEEAQLDAAIAGTHGLGAALYSGVAGIAFVLAHLGHEIDEGVDRALADTLRPEAHFDLISGPVGLAVYALEAMPATRPLLERAIATLDAAARPGAVGRYLFTPARFIGIGLAKRCPNGAIDLGVAHGQPGAIAVAAAAASWGIAGARALYDDLTAYLWSAARDDGDARFSAVTEYPQPRRSAWCYGDPGIAAALFAAATAVGDAPGRARALELAHLAARRAPEATLADEAQLCHGAIGLAHIYNRLAQASDDATLAAAAHTWYERALALPDPETLELLEGRLGIALALHAATTATEPLWDRALCVTVRAADAV